MKLFSSSRTSVGAILLVVAAGTLVHAQQEWTGAVDNDWTNAGNWNSSVPQSGDVAIFDNAGNGNTTINLGGATQPINGLYFDTASAAAYTIGQQTGDTLDFDSGGTVTVTNAVTTSQTINAAVNVNGAGMLVYNNVNNGGALIGNGVVGLTFGDVNISSGVFSVTNGADLGSGGVPTTATALNGDITGDGAL